MFSEVEERHSTPHFHAYYQNYVAVFGIETVEILAGNLPKRQSRFVKAWAEMHQSELLDDWNALQKGCKPVAIKPLS
jgi:hypothetical protein